MITLLCGMGIAEGNLLQLQERMLLDLADIFINEGNAMEALGEVSRIMPSFMLVWGYNLRMSN